MKYNYTKEKTKIDGLSFVPKLIGWGMDEDGAPHPDNFYTLPDVEIHDGERKVVEKIIERYKKFPINIMEIGVSRNGDRSFTNILLENKHPKSKYLGIDIQDKSFLNDDKKSILNDVLEYSFSKIKLSKTPPNTKVQVIHLRVPPHYQMGGMVYLNRIRRKIVDKVYLSLHGVKRPI
jgi:hypothetical protein